MLKDHFSRLTLSIISRIVLGEKYFSESSIVRLEEFQEMLDEVFLLSGVLHIGDWIPWISFLDLQGHVKRMKALRDKVNRFQDDMLEKHRAKRSGIEDSAGDKDMVDMLLRLADDPDLEVKITTDGVKALALVSIHISFDMYRILI